MHQILLAYGKYCLTHLTRERLREFVMSLQVIIYAKQNGAQMATFAATGTRADIDDLGKTMVALGTRLPVCSSLRFISEASHLNLMFFCVFNLFLLS